MPSRRNRQIVLSALPLIALLFLSAAAKAESPAARAAAGGQGSVRAANLHQRAVSTTALTVASAEGSNGGGVTLLATVDGPAGATPHGSVVFTAGGKRIGEAAIAHGSAALTVPALPAGTIGLAASYQGDGNFLPSRSITIRFYKDEQD